MKFKIYTDGACSGNPGPGGWGAVILDKENNLRWTLSLQKMFLDRVGNDKYKILFFETFCFLNCFDFITIEGCVFWPCNSIRY